MATRTYPTMYERLVAHVTLAEGQNENGCWEHDGQMSKPVGGYPRISVRLPGGKHAKRLAHVLMYREVHGEVPEGHEVYHLCHNHRCINPDHLHAMPMPDNRRRMPWHRNP